MPRLPSVKTKELIKALSKMGFFESRQKGSHLIMKHSDGRRAVIPLHSKSAIPKGTLKGILRDIEITTEDLLECL